MQQRRDDRFLIEFQIGQDASDFDRMAEIGVAARALLAAVFLDGKNISAVEQILIRVGIIFPDFFHKLVLP